MALRATEGNQGAFWGAPSRECTWSCGPSIGMKNTRAGEYAAKRGSTGACFSTERCSTPNAARIPRSRHRSFTVAASMRRPAYVKNFFGRMGNCALHQPAGENYKLPKHLPIRIFFVGHYPRRIALLPFALLVELLAPVPVGVLNS